MVSFSKIYDVPDLEYPYSEKRKKKKKKSNDLQSVCGIMCLYADAGSAGETLPNVLDAARNNEHHMS